MKIFNSKSENIQLEQDFKNADKFILKVILLQWLLVSSLGGLQYHNYFFGFIGGFLLSIVAIIGYRYYQGTPMLRVLNGIILMIFSVILIQQNLGTIEMHFHIFVMLSFLVVYKDILPVTIASLFIAVHHLLFTYLQLNGIQIDGMDIVIYNYGCGFDIAFLHAFFVILEWTILIILINSMKQQYQKIIKNQCEIESIHKNTKDSIEYASLIQKALIPEKSLFRSYFADYFTLWEPKDIVGGDIYLFEELRDKDECLLMVIDCTGHGVPGAFVTMLVKAIERQIVGKIENDKEIDVSPAWILAYFNKTMKKLLQQENEKSISNAGFDGGIIYYNKKEQIIKFSGAETALFYTDEKNELQTIKGSRHSVGYKKSKTSFEFKEHTIKVQEGMKFYLTTDGYLDQNGGDRGFPMGKKKFSASLAKNNSKSFEQQKEILLNELKTYQKDEIRNDDITVVGFEIDKQAVVKEILKYNGVLTQGIISHSMDIIENNIQDINLMGKISTITVELTQNMMHYSKSKSPDSREIVPAGFIEITQGDESVYQIKSESIISLEDKNKIDTALIEVKSLNEQEIKNRYRELRKSGANTHAKGGGIGFYEIAKLVQEFEYSFTEMNAQKFKYTFKAILSPKKKSNKIMDT